MKKTIIIFLVLLMLFALSACQNNQENNSQSNTSNGTNNYNSFDDATDEKVDKDNSTASGNAENIEVDEAVKATIDAIDKIGFINENSGDAIKTAEQLYLALTPQQKTEVFNYSTLENSRKEFASLPKSVALTPDNFKDFFHIENKASDSDIFYTYGNVSYYETHMKVETKISSKVKLETIENVSITIRFFVEQEFDDEIREVPAEETTITVNVSSISGIGESIKNIKRMRVEKNGKNYSHLFLNLDIKYYEIESVTGTVKYIQ